MGNPAVEEIPETPPDGPPARPKRSWGMIAAALGCWFAGTHVVVLVPGVILFFLIKLCLEEGWADILLIRPGLLMMAMAGLSALSTTGWMMAGLAFFRGRPRRGLVFLLVAVGSAVLTILVFLTL